MKLKTPHTLKLRLVCLAALAVVSMVASSSADTVFSGGDIRTAGNWDLGLPTSAEDGQIATNGTVGGNFNGGGSTNFVNSTVNHTAGTITGVYNANAAGLVYNLTGGEINSSSGNFNANSGSVFNLLGGQVRFGNDLIVNSSVGGITVGGNVTISTNNAFDLRLNQNGSFFSIDPNWTGSFESPSETTLNEWYAELVTGATPAGSGSGTAAQQAYGNYIDVGGTDVTSLTQFQSLFELVPGTTSLQLIQPAVVPEPSSLALLGLGVLGMVTRRRR